MIARRQRHEAVALRHHLVDRAQRRHQRRHRPRAHIDQAEARFAALEKRRADLAIGMQRVGAIAQRPQRPAEVGRARVHGAHALARLVGVEVVPAGAIRQEQQRAVRHPDGL